jgi:hypothetical protein
MTYQPSYVDLRALDLAWHRYKGGAVQLGHARDDMVEFGGVTRSMAERLLDRPTTPSAGFQLPRRPR